jgi:hypothetical protein
MMGDPITGRPATRVKFRKTAKFIDLSPATCPVLSWPAHVQYASPACRAASTLVMIQHLQDDRAVSATIRDAGSGSSRR